MNEYWLSSLDSYRLSNPRHCKVLRETTLNGQKNALIVELSDGIQIENENGWKFYTKVILTARHTDFDVINIKYFPTFVYVLGYENEYLEYHDFIDKNADVLIPLGIGELYRTEEDAKSHKFDP